MQSFFIWNGIDCRSLGITLAGPVPIVRPEERVRHVEIPGRSGDLTQLEGEEVYNSYIQTATIQVRSGSRVREVYKWLRGAGYVTFSGEPDRRQQARIIGAITLNKHSRNINTWVGEVQFYCQPLKELLLPEDVEIENSGDVVRNYGDVTSKPLWKLTASGSQAVLSSGNRELTVRNLSSGQEILIDSEVMEVLNSDRTDTLTKNALGGFPVLVPGENSVTGSGWSKVEIEKRERYL